MMSDDEHPTRLWDIDTHRLVAYLDGTIPDYDIPNLARTSVFSHDSRFVTTVDEQTVFVWFAANGKAADKLELSTEGRVWGSSFSPAVNELAIADFDGLARIWRLSGKGSTTELRGHTGPVWSAVFSPDGRSVLTSTIVGCGVRRQHRHVCRKRRTAPKGGVQLRCPLCGYAGKHHFCTHNGNIASRGG
jgi:WD40 repeat protein